MKEKYKFLKNKGGKMGRISYIIGLVILILGLIRMWFKAH